ncbi:ferredoxin [Mycolicibacterium parafortuitum]|uniref:ferredoxin n=1 Tax=Mycolicibacterium parafortuitum TaxID=39692 RepID=UPI0013D56976|nr:ferredoxin [Mycolicibacterium parafortuitum]
MHVTVDRLRCTAIGLCESHAPDIFSLNEGDELDIADDIPGFQEEDVRRAVADCPMKALRFT